MENLVTVRLATRDAKMNTCPKCHGDVQVRPVVWYELRKELVGGIDVKVVDAVSEVVCSKCNFVLRTDIPNLPGLIASIAVARSKSVAKLNGPEIRFLRKTLGISAKDLAAALDVAEETVSRWENGHLAIGSATERLFRLKVCIELSEKAPGVKWDDEEILFRMNIVAVASIESSTPFIFCLQKERRASRRDAHARWLEKKAA
jgi:DNA-binding XRE family transcriptional regulator